MESKPRASSVCSLDDAPDDWRGYLAPAEIAAGLAGIAATLRDQGKSDLVERIADICRTLPEGGAITPASDIAAAFEQLLPRIKDDRLHAAVTAIRAAL